MAIHRTLSAGPCLLNAKHLITPPGFFTVRQPAISASNAWRTQEGIASSSAQAYSLRVMGGILDLVKDCPRREFASGEIVIEQGRVDPAIFILVEGEVEVLRDEVRLAKSSEPGAVFGEISALLGGAYTARVRALKPSTFVVVVDPEALFAASAEASLHVARLLARRINALNQYLVDVKRQYEGHDHLGMVDDVLDTLMHRPQRG